MGEGAAAWRGAGSREEGEGGATETFPNCPEANDPYIPPCLLPPLTCALVSVDCGAEEHQVGSKHGLDQGQRDRGGFIDHEQLSLGQLGMVLGLDVLDSLAVQKLAVQEGERSKGGV